MWASFALGPMQMPWVAQSVLLGGHVRVGLEDNLYLSKGVKATNAQLVERAQDDRGEHGRPRRHPRRGPRDPRAEAPMSPGAAGTGGRPDRHLHRRRRDRRRLGGLLPGPRLPRGGLGPGRGRRDRGCGTSSSAGLAGARPSWAWPRARAWTTSSSSTTWRPPARRRTSCRRARRRTSTSSARCWPTSTRRRRPGVVISSSTSGYGMSEMQTKCAHPERTVVGHPFNPPYLIPLVEVVGGTGDLARGGRVDLATSSGTPASP